MSELHTKDQHLNNFKISFVKLTCALVLLTGLFYLYRFIFIHKQLIYITPISIGILLTLISCVFVYKKKFKAASYLLLIPVTFCSIILVGSVGGFTAPGLQWITLIPVIYTALIGRKGIPLGIIAYIATCLIFKFYNIQTFSLSIEQYQTEKELNFFLFSFFAFIFILSYMFIVEKLEFSLRRKNNEIDNLLRVLLHDISNPALIMKISIAQLRGANNTDPECLARMERSYSTLENIIKDVKKIQAADDEKTSLTIKEITVENLFNDLHFLFKETYSHKNIKLKLINNVDNNYTISTDESIFKNQILNNLISNAIKFSPRDEEIQIVVNIVDKFLKVDVINKGKEIDIKNFDKIISPYQKTSTPGTQGERGTGYGLPLVNTFIHKLGGKLSPSTLSDRNDTGTCMTITLPLNS